MRREQTLVIPKLHRPSPCPFVLPFSPTKTSVGMAYHTNHGIHALYDLHLIPGGSSRKSDITFGSRSPTLPRLRGPKTESKRKVRHKAGWTRAPQAINLRVVFSSEKGQIVRLEGRPGAHLADKLGAVLAQRMARAAASDTRHEPRAYHLLHHFPSWEHAETPSKCWTLCWRGSA